MKISLKNRIIILSLFLIFKTCFSNSFLILEGEKYDCLINVKSNSYFLENKLTHLENKILYGYYFFHNSNLYRFYENKIDCINNLKQNLTIPVTEKDILPKVSYPTSIQMLVKNNSLIIPYKFGGVIINLNNLKFKKYSNLNIFNFEQNKIKISDFFIFKDNFYNLRNNIFSLFSNGKMEKIYRFNVKDSYENSSYLLKNRVILVSSTVKQGDLSSFRVNLQCYDLEKNYPFNRNFDGIFRNGSTDGNNLLVINYKKASIISELFSKNKIYFKLINFKNNSSNIETFSFKVTHKRSHIFYFFNNENQLIALIQCKNGDIFTFNCKTMDFKKENLNYNYNYSFIRGKNGGCFFDKENNSFSVINFN